MVDVKRKKGEEHDQAIHPQNARGEKGIGLSFLGHIATLVLDVALQVKARGECQGEVHQNRRSEESHKDNVVASTDAISHPRAMVVKPFDAVVAGEKQSAVKLSQTFSRAQFHLKKRVTSRRSAWIAQGERCCTWRSTLESPSASSQFRG